MMKDQKSSGCPLWLLPINIIPEALVRAIRQ
jgi:hypothetical protein